eukprot:701821-Pelagomonas_calceolata.AAC.7
MQPALEVAANNNADSPGSRMKVKTRNVLEGGGGGGGECAGMGWAALRAPWAEVSVGKAAEGASADAEDRSWGLTPAAFDAAGWGVLPVRLKLSCCHCSEAVREGTLCFSPLASPNSSPPP